MNRDVPESREPARYATPAVVPLLPEQTLAAFGIDDPHVEWLSGGRTNRTLRVRAGRDLVIQHMRGSAHGDLLGIMENLVRVTSHLDWRRLMGSASSTEAADTREDREIPVHRWYPELVPTSAGKPFIMTEEGDVWRAFSFRPGQILRSEQSLSTLASAGAMYGRFTAQTADLGGPPLIETAPGFHDLDRVFEQLIGDIGQAANSRSGPIVERMPIIEKTKARVDEFVRADGLTTVVHRVVHNDTKLSNVLFDRDQGRAKAVLDLDLVMMGPSWHDVGDLIRSASWHAPGTTNGGTCFSVELFDATVGAFVEAAGETLTDGEVVTYAAAGPRISLELGLRYLNDHLRDEPRLRVEAENGSLVRGFENVKLAGEMLGAYDALRHKVEGFVDDRRARNARNEGTP